MLSLYRANGKDNESYYSMLGLYSDNGKENGSYCSGYLEGHGALVNILVPPTSHVVTSVNPTYY